MRNYTIIPKVALVVCLVLIILTVINEMTGFINSTISLNGTVICIIGFSIAIFAIIILEKEREKRQ